MARVATSDWVSGKVTPARLRIYHVLLVIVMTLLAIAVATPTVLAQRTLYKASATVRYDPALFAPLMDGKKPTPAFQNMRDQLGEVLKDRYPGLGSSIRGFDVQNTSPGTVQIIAITPLITQSVDLANAAAQGMASRIFADLGRPILRDILGRQLQEALEGHPPQAREDQILRRLIETDAVYDRITPAPGRLTLADLTPLQRSAVTRVLEIQDDLTSLALQRADRQIAQGGDAATLTEIRSQRKHAADQLLSVRLALHYFYDTYKTSFNVTASGPAFVAEPATESTPRPAYQLVMLLIAGAAGLIGGIFIVLLDRAVGIAAKLEELWAYRELMRNMVLRDLRARYKNSLLGYLWSLLNPLMTMLIFWLVFSVLLQNSIPMYPVFLIVALLPWNFAVTAVSGGMRAILDNANLVKKVYFPREILPITVVLANFVNYVLAFPVMLVVMAGVQYNYLGYLQFSWTFLFLPVIIGIQIIFLIGITLLLSTMAVFFRDTTHIIDILIQLWIFLTPVFYTLEAVTQGNVLAAKAVRWLNPMASLVDFYRDVLYGQASGPVPGIPALDGVFRTFITALVILAIGAYVFHRYSAHFGEEL